MSDFDAIDSLLASLTPEAELPEAAVRRDLREQAGLSKAQVARTLGVGPSTVAGWEAGRDPAGQTRTRYAYLLDGLAAKLAPATSPEDGGAEPPAAPETVAPPPETAGAVDGDDVETLTAPEPCVLCGGPATQRVAGFPQHLDPADCHTTAPLQSAPTTSQPTAAPPPARTGRASSSAPHHTSRSTKSPSRRAFPPADDASGLIVSSVQAALTAHAGDVEAATAALLKKAIPDAMALLDETRKGGRYDVIAHPWLPDILKKKSKHDADQIWEARPKWTRPQLPPGTHEVTALDINGAYLSALKTHLPIGQLEHSTDGRHDRRRAGVHLITPPHWDHEDTLPNPLGQRDEPGPLWVTEPTLRLLLRLSGPKHALCEPPVIHESYTSGATEGLLEKFRIALKDARDTAIAQQDEVMLEYVKAMYSKFVSTMGTSTYNRELNRPDWMHLIRSQAFANLWMKTLKAHEEGLTVVRAMGTDELHVIGEWRRVFPEGRGVTEVKIKDIYMAGAADDAAPEAGEGA
ncbi:MULTISPECIES: helix-turn-helix domain-containing protein [unclassified Streptomyces]|uniref:helix-turn-helix domain-containing protein n=1 Tax=unclassified Streptomyces TaxID=2593676 RepID=UPI002E18752F|nr:MULTISPECIES: helix-turn-helix domain-containing protein [unclassified Streptomyces]